MFGGLRGLVKHLRSSTAVFVYVLALYFLLMVHQVPIGESGFHLGLPNPQQMISMIVIDQTGQTDWISYWYGPSWNFDRSLAVTAGWCEASYWAIVQIETNRTHLSLSERCPVEHKIWWVDIVHWTMDIVHPPNLSNSCNYLAFKWWCHRVMCKSSIIWTEEI